MTKVAEEGYSIYKIREREEVPTVRVGLDNRLHVSGRGFDKGDVAVTQTGVELHYKENFSMAGNNSPPKPPGFL